MIKREKHVTHSTSYKKPASKNAWRRRRRAPVKSRGALLERDIAGTWPPNERVLECQLSLVESRAQGVRQSTLPELRSLAKQKPSEPEEYDKWKAVSERIKEEIEKTDYTRRVVWRAKSVQKTCEAGIAGCVFSLLMKRFTGVELVNGTFAVFLCFSLSVYWAMAWLKNRKLSNEP